MRRVLVLVFVLLSMVWQATAVAGPMALGHGQQGLEHAVLHWQDEGHHHHDDGSYHEDDSDASVQHLALDAGLAAPALWGSSSLVVGVKETAPPAMRELQAPPEPSLRGFRRPPRATS